MQSPTGYIHILGLCRHTHVKSYLSTQSGEAEEPAGTSRGAAWRIGHSHLRAKAPSAWAGRVLIPTYPKTGMTFPLQCQSRSISPPQATRGGACPALSSRYGVRLHRAVVEERDDGPPQGQSTGKPIEALTHLPANAPPSPGRQCSAPENTLEGEGSRVLRRAVCGEAVERSADRRRTLDSSPIGTPKKEPLHPSPVAFLILFAGPTWAGFIPPRLLCGGHRHPDAFLSTVRDQLSRILG